MTDRKDSVEGKPSSCYIPCVETDEKLGAGNVESRQKKSKPTAHKVLVIMMRISWPLLPRRNKTKTFEMSTLRCYWFYLSLT